LASVALASLPVGVQVERVLRSTVPLGAAAVVVTSRRGGITQAGFNGTAVS